MSLISEMLLEFIALESFHFGMMVSGGLHMMTICMFAGKDHISQEAA